MKTIFTVLFCFFLLPLFSQTAESYFKEAEQKYSSQNYKEAILLYSKAIKLDPEKVNYYLRRGFCHDVLKDYDSAIEDYSQVIRIDPKQKWAYNSRGSAKNKINAFKDALKDFDAAIALDSKDCEAYNNRGFAKKMLGDKDGACADWNKSKKMGNEEAKIILKNNHCK